MKIHTDKLTLGDLQGAVPVGAYLEAIERGSRSRARGFDVRMSAEPGTDRHGIRRRYANSGTHGAPRSWGWKAATWIEWGDWMVELLRLDPEAIIGPYDGAEGFIELTQRYAPSRPDREHAVEHAERWARELSDPSDEDARVRP